MATEIPRPLAEPPFQVYGDYTRERQIRDERDFYMLFMQMCKYITELEARVAALEP